MRRLPMAVDLSDFHSFSYEVTSSGIASFIISIHFIKIFMKSTFIIISFFICLLHIGLL